MASRDVVFLGEPLSRDEALVGAKAANLAVIAADFPVPPGFCVTAEVFARFAERGEGAKEHLRELIAPAYHRLSRGDGLQVAVRSSAIGEDSAGASFAGQHDTFLHITGVDAVVDAVMRCWASLGSDRAVAYRERTRAAAAAAMPVLVQRLVPADASAVAFSADPLTGELGAVRVNVAHGLGEGLVSGAVTPDVYLVTADPAGIRERRIAAAEPVLADGTVLEIAALATALEARFGRPVDVELAIASGTVHVVQCRPITTLPEAFVVEWPDPAYAKLSWSRDLLHTPVAFPPLSADKSMMTNRSTADATAYFSSPFRGRAIHMNGYLYGSTEPLGDDDELTTKMERAIRKRRAFGRKLPGFWETKILPYLREMYAWMDAAPLETASAEEAAAMWRELDDRMFRAWQLHFYIVGTAYPVLDELASLYEELFPGRSGIEALGLTLGLSNEIHEMQGELHDLAELARAAGEASADFRVAFDRFIGRHGHLGHTYNDMRLPSWADEPERVLEEVRKRVARPSEDPREVRRRALAAAHELEARIRADLADRPAELARFDEVLTAARGVQPLTEGHNYELDRKAQSLHRRFTLRAGERLVRAGVVASPSDVFFLRSSEVADALADERDRRELVASRAADLARQERMRPPLMLGSAPRPLPKAFARNRYFGAPVASPDGGIRGTGASAGVARGIARRVDGPDDFDRVRPGDVLFCHATNPTYVPLFGIIAALVTDVGGELCHAAVVAREFGVPAVVGARDALTRVPEGATVEVDGGAGTVRILEGV